MRSTSASKEEARWALYRSYVRLAPTDPRYWVFQVPYRFRGRRRFSTEFVETVGRINLPVQEWIVDDADDMRQPDRAGASTGIISDRPDLAMTIVKLEGEAGPGSRRSLQTRTAPGRMRRHAA